MAAVLAARDRGNCRPLPVVAVAKGARPWPWPDLAVPVLAKGLPSATGVLFGVAVHVRDIGIPAIYGQWHDWGLQQSVMSVNSATLASRLPVFPSQR